MTEPEVAIRLRGLTKTFGSVTANDRIDLDVRGGEILSLLGENGSGKTTLMNMLSGIYQPDAGSIEIKGPTIHIVLPHDAISHLGIGMMHQHFKLVDLFTARENIRLGSSGKPRPLRGRGVLNQLGLKVDLDKKVYAMSVSEKQSVEILKVLTWGAEILILDEPTAVLTPQGGSRTCLTSCAP